MKNRSENKIGDTFQKEINDSVELEKQVKLQVLTLQKDRQYQLLQGFMIYFILSAVIMVAVTFVRDNVGVGQKIVELLIGLCMLLFFALLMTFIYKKSTNYIVFDNFVLIMTLIYSSFSMFFSQDNLILANVIYFPVFLFFVFSTLSTIRITIFLSVHISLTIYSYLSHPYFSFQMNPTNYLTIIMSSITVFVLAFRLMVLYNSNIKKMSQDYIELSQRNIELNALNEEYYATQEELFDKYDEVSLLNQNNEKLAFFDSLTHLPNRNGFLRYICELKNEKIHTQYVVFADIERFKDINSVYSYVIGDELICEIARRLSTLPLKINTSARIAGDLFALVIEGDYEKQDLINKLSLLTDEFITENFSIALKMNFGILKLQEYHLEAEEILRSVDAALNQAKVYRHQNYCFYDRHLVEETEKWFVMNQALEKAIQNNQIISVFQAIIDTSTQEIIAYETLARWTDEVLGPISPIDFIQLAERTGLIIPLSEKIIHQACQFIQRLSGDYEKIMVSVNLSGAQLRTDGFCDSIIAIVDEYQIDYSRIGLEVTETDMIYDFENADNQLRLLKEKGFRVYLDDFGTGYSSLNYLGRLPIDIIKIDRSFITDIHNKPEQQPMIKAIVTLARDCKLITVAEGVETEEEYEFLKTMGIELIQGYLFSRPKPSSLIAL